MCLMCVFLLADSFLSSRNLAAYPSLKPRNSPVALFFPSHLVSTGLPDLLAVEWASCCPGWLCHSYTGSGE